ncbi:uncharacterized protein F5Z01DRAFT_4344 [Emericellopsis atlantica]|uniref:Rhodopsin domain-containing protein n=1 Tax=Emericellopsis atlantica TaxID=2614577 RepID=A0A9P7ZUY8_9HYPO|nr:uncharacterized protein F5Z01DRAFT_4344 [Emericellopsis atlantica]KAG9258803.1 hypothetical protein F5Z01DRAFT_4344 [Emericellopsis atlantica]
MSTEPPFIVDGEVMFIHPPDDWPTDEFSWRDPVRSFVQEHYFIFGVMGSLALIALCQRFYTKAFLSKGLAVDDLFMFFAWITSVTTQALMCYQVANKTLGLHGWEMIASRFAKDMPVTYATAGIFQMCNGFTKLSLLTFYLQISPQRGWKIANWIAIAIVAVSSTVITLMLYLYCRPPAKAYMPQLEGDCLNPGALYIATAVSNIVTDLMLFVLPIPMVVKLRMSKVQKAGAVFIFGVGSVTVATSGVRLYYLMNVLNTQDLTWDAAQANIWSLIEANLFIICGSMPTLRKFFKHFAPRLMGGSSANTNSGGYRHYGGSSGARLETIGGTNKETRKARSRYMEMDDMHDLSPTTRNDIGTDDNVDRVHNDNGSDKAILQTKTVEVSYS